MNISRRLRDILTRTLQRAKRVGFLRHVLTLMSATVAAQVLSLLATPVLSRLYTPSDFGLYGLFFGVVMTVSIVASGRYEFAIMLANGTRDARGLLLLSLVVLLASVCVVGVVAMMLSPWAAQSFGVSTARVLTMLFPLTVLIMGVYQSLFQWAARHKRYPDMARARVSQILVTAIVGVLLGVLGVKQLGLLLGFVCGQVVASGYMLVLFRDDLSRAVRGSSAQLLRSLATSYRDFPRVNAVHALVGGLSDAGTNSMMAIIYGPATAGQYSMAHRMTRAPMSLVGASVAQVFYQESVARSAQGELEPFVKRLMSTLGVMALPFGLALVLFGPDIFEIVFGASWRTAGQYGQVLAPWLLLSFVVSPLSTLPALAGELTRAFRIALVDLGGKVIGLTAGALVGSALLGLAVLSASSALVLAYQVRWYLQLARRCDLENASEESCSLASAAEFPEAAR